MTASETCSFTWTDLFETLLAQIGTYSLGFVPQSLVSFVNSPFTILILL